MLEKNWREREEGYISREAGLSYQEN